MSSYLDSLTPLLPNDTRERLDEALQAPDVRSIFETVLRLAVGAPAPESDIVSGWDGLQDRAARIVGELRRAELGQSHKRSRDDEPQSSSKRLRSDNGASPSASSEDDPPIFTLHALSVSSPIRKKVNITVHRSSIRLVNPATQNEEHAPIPLAALQRAFLLSTRGKSKPHWTVALMASDVPAPTGKAADASKETPVPQLVFGLDANLVGSFSTTTYHAEGSPRTEPYTKGDATLPALRSFLSHIPVTTFEPSTSIFRSALAPAGDGVAGVEAYRGAKPGTLWFLHEGVLWDGKPCEFFALEHLAPATKSEQSYEGVRTLSATGRTCSVILRRIRARSDRASSTGDDDDDEEVEGEDIDFGMVDGREQETIGRWIKSHRHLFGKPATSANAAPGVNGGAADVKGKGKAVAEDPRNEDTEDEEDSDFTMDSSDDESSSDDSDEEDGSGGEGGGSDEEGDASDDATGDEEEAEAEEDLDPKHHPLLRPGAMPRMSRAAVEAVVGMVEQDLMGTGRSAAQADDSDEEDELDD
ncbi:hypothetical protein PYCCODRAFT_1430543 [Trametes coccinea BRFM310]|uniref:Histone chaperone RTT106/FACT complex subunit SPT16-like middle domain-containing protein n=1 Tax=Trametes coccinea (strain BRFM310) TaxID=1353009 RepID=A0A1Y2J1L4_TRAC3|nr:hypothetical protein PYCCODRAFT_1430543 [Trametes coccinea BRFM310]